MTEPLQGRKSNVIAVRIYRLLHVPSDPPPQLGQNREILPLQFLVHGKVERLAEVDVRAVQVGEVEEPDSAFVGVTEQTDELLEAHVRLVGLAAAAVDA